MFDGNLFTYKEHKIISAVPLPEIREYLREIGAVEKPGKNYDFPGLEIEVVLYEGDDFPDIGVSRHTITVHGDPSAAEDFLTAYRFKFMSAGG